MKDLAGFFGWISAIGYGGALLNFFIKYINKKYIVKLSKDKKKFVNYYRILMRFVVKYHRYFGIIGSIAVIVHFIIMFNVEGLSITGIIAAGTMWIVFLLGIYGTYINKNVRGNWVKIHRSLAFILIIMLFIHLVFKESFIIRF
jgi:hypothetical protein